MKVYTRPTPHAIDTSSIAFPFCRGGTTITFNTTTQRINIPDETYTTLSAGDATQRYAATPLAERVSDAGTIVTA